MLTITLNLPKKVEKQLDKDLEKLETLTKRPREFHLKKALIWYLEEANKLKKNYEKERTKGNFKYHTEEDLLESLGLKEVDWEK